MTQIFCLTAGLSDGASIPRVHSIKHLEETGYPCVVQVSTQINTFDLDWADIVMLHRPIEETHVKIAKLCKEKGKKLWVDNDDDQLSVPIDHPAYLQYNRDDRKAYIRDTNRMADVVTISNPEILKSYSELNQYIVYYPCAYDERIMPEPDFSPRDKVVLWRGSQTHRKSVAEFAPAIGRVDKKIKGWRFVFIGDYPWQMLEGITENEWLCHSDYLATQELWHYSRSFKPAIQIVCLTDNQFTRSRSNMAQLDATIAGARTLAPNWPHFAADGVALYSGVLGFERELQQLMNDWTPMGFKASVERSWGHIQKNQTFKAINVKQWEIVKSLVGNAL